MCDGRRRRDSVRVSSVRPHQSSARGLSCQHISHPGPQELDQTCHNESVPQLSHNPLQLHLLVEPRGCWLFWGVTWRFYLQQVQVYSEDVGRLGWFLPLVRTRRGSLGGNIDPESLRRFPCSSREGSCSVPVALVLQVLRGHKKDPEFF